jgi:hypothetical protein
MTPLTVQPRYSGPGRSGFCVCGHAWERHHLGVVLNADYFEATKEAYLPQECEAFGFNEVGGLMNVDGEWVDHCHRYVDALAEINE